MMPHYTLTLTVRLALMLGVALVGVGFIIGRFA